MRVPSLLLDRSYLNTIAVAIRLLEAVTNMHTSTLL